MKPFRGAVLCVVIVLTHFKDIYGEVQREIESGRDLSNQRSRREILDVLFFGTSILLKTTSQGLSLANEITRGCATYSSICTDKKAIESLTSEIVTLKHQYENLYLENKREYVALRESSTRNSYISYYINETIKALDNLDDTEEMISQKLQMQMPALLSTFTASKHPSSGQYIELLLNTLELGLNDIDGLAKRHKDSPLIEIVTQSLVEASVSKFFELYTKSFNQISSKSNAHILHNAMWSALFSAPVLDAAAILDPHDHRHAFIMRKYRVPTIITQKFQSNYRLSGMALKNVFKHGTKYFHDHRTRIQTVTVTRSLDQFKGVMVHMLQKPIANLELTKRFVTGVNTMKYQISHFKLDWSERIMKGLDIISDAMSIASAQRKWRKVRDELHKARQEYEKYKTDLVSALNELKTNKQDITNQFTSVMTTFTAIVKPFRDFVKDTILHSDYYAALEHKHLAIDRSDTLFSTDIDHVSKNDIAQKQNLVISSTRDKRSKVIDVKEEISAILTLYTKIFERKQHKDKVDAILNLMKSIYKLESSTPKHEFGTRLQKRDIVCVISGLDQGASTYDFYPLSGFRPSCAVSNSDFAKYELETSKQRKSVILHTTVDRKLATNSSIELPYLLSLIKQTYSSNHDADLRNFGKSVTEKDVICYISSSHTHIKEFDGISLSSFRPSCDAVSDNTFHTMLQKANSIRHLKAEVSTVLTACRRHHLCPCIAEIASKNRASQSDVKAIIHKLWHQPKYCGTSGCACVTL